MQSEKDIKDVEALVKAGDDRSGVASTITHSNHEDPLVGDKEFGDFRDQLKKGGYAVVPGALSKDRAQYYVDKTLKYLEDFDLGFNHSDPSTYRGDFLPLIGPSGVMSNYRVGHEAFVWEARCEPGVMDVFAKLWGTKELLVSYDAINVSLPDKKRADGVEGLKFWPHIDQEPSLRGFDCAQGIINLTKTGPLDAGLVVMVGSHALHEEYWGENGPRFADKTRIFKPEHLKWFEEKGCKFVKVEAEPGDVILWDSRTIHYGAPAEGDTTRVVFYACYGPASRCSAEGLKLKTDIFSKWEVTGHHPTRPKLHHVYPPIRNGLPDPKDRAEPYEKPDLGNERLLRLAGVMAY